MQHHKKMQDILNRIAIFDKLYDVIRLVDPTMKRVIEHDNFSNTSGNVLDSTCYYFWQRNQICDNCISIRAFNENTTYVKIEYNLKDIFMVTAIPYEMEERRVIIELIKNITDSMVFESTIPGKKSEVHTLIDGINILALSDSLTGLYNRRYISERLPVDLVSSVLAKQDISIIMADKVLKMSSKAILNSIRRESDWVSRFGGEEFLICLPGAGTEKAVEIAEGIRKEIEAMEIDLGKQKIHITTSLGISSFGSIQGHTTDDLIEAADAKLYLAKNKGRNKVEY